MRIFSDPLCHKTKFNDLTTRSLDALLAAFRLSIALPLKVPSKSDAGLILRKESTELFGFILSSPCPELGSVPTDTCPLELMRSLSLLPTPVSTIKLLPLSPYILALFVVPFAQVS